MIDFINKFADISRWNSFLILKKETVSLIIKDYSTIIILLISLYPAYNPNSNQNKQPYKNWLSDA